MKGFIYYAGDQSYAGSGGKGKKPITEKQKRLDLTAEFWTHYQNARAEEKCDFTAEDVRQMLLLSEIASIATEGSDGQP